MMGRYYILEGREIREIPDLLEWARWFNTDRKSIARKRFYFRKITVSTVFLGIDHSFDDGAPLLFETMVFGGTLDGEMERYSTYEEALAGHKAMVKRVRRS